ncbi:cadherin-like domain-containing protein, partial [Altererythrobacter sp. C41]|uniref:cadherin-like domain-containing protein n=1 Tax=Altererythrobacter sp. C41 TaxID=2806021 RepID=UPI0019317852
APIAVADTDAATEDAAAVTGTVAGNDSDADGDTLTFALAAPVAGLTLNADGSYSFDPSDVAYQDLAVGETRDVVASYTVSDGNGGTATSTLTITVTGTNDAPVAVADIAAASEDAAAVTGTVAGNDSDADGDTLTFALAAPVAGLTLNSDGSYSFDPSDAAYQDLAVGETRDVVASYTVSDGNGGTASSTLTITVTGANDAPTAVADTSAAAEDAAAVTGTVAGNDSDVDGDTLSYTLDAAVAGLTLNADGSYSFDPSDAAYQDLAAGETRDVVAGYTVSDGNGGTASSTLTITVTGTNDAPTAGADSYTVAEDAALTIAAAAGVLTNDGDTDGDALSALLVAGPANGTLTLNADGSFVYTPNADYIGPDSFTYRANDGTADSAPVTVDITVTPSNDAPTAAADTDAATEDAAAVTGTVAGNDSDADGDTLSYTLDAAVAGLTLNADGSYSFDPSDAAYQDLAVGETRDVVASYTVSDGNSGAATSTLTITVTGTNDAPAAAADLYAVTEDDTLTIAAAAGVLANDSDPDGDALSALLVTGPANGTLTLSPDGSFVYTPNADYIGPDSFTYRANDGTADSAPVTVDITVTPSNDAPIAVADTDAATEDAAPVTGTVAGNDSDADGDTLSYTLDAAVAGLTFNADGS